MVIMLPQEMLKIFQNNIVIMHGQPTSSVGGGPDYLKISDKVGAEGWVRGHGQSIKCTVKKIEAASPGDEGAFLTWICDYQQDGIKYRTLDNSRPFCFTANINGCTFGIGAKQPGGVLTVSHANARTEGNGNISQQTRFQSSMGNNDANNFDARHYNTGQRNGMGYNTTIVGICDNGAWTFYYQSYLKRGFEYVLQTFKKIEVDRLNI